MFDSLESLNGKEISVDLPLDEDGMLGRSCPNQDCNGYFKIKADTFQPADDEDYFYCAYCGTYQDYNDFVTKEQLEYGESYALRLIQNALNTDLKGWAHQQNRKSHGGFLQIKLEVTSNPLPLYLYEEKELETTINCDQCGLIYAVYGAFGYCPGCGITNPILILKKNLELTKKLLDFANQLKNDPEFQNHLYKRVLESIVSAFEGFGKGINKVYKQKANHPEKVTSISFQNIQKTDEKINELYGFKVSTLLDEKEWGFLNTMFQKRHIISHNEGIIDQSYLDRSGDDESFLGRKIKLDTEGLSKTIEIVEKLSDKFNQQMNSL